MWNFLKEFLKRTNNTINVFFGKNSNDTVEQWEPVTVNLGLQITYGEKEVLIKLIQEMVAYLH
jgi:hypothetical protein